MTILDLPVELIVYIFEYVSYDLLCLYNIERTCKLFETIVRNYEWNSKMCTERLLTEHVFMYYKFNYLTVHADLNNPLGLFCRSNNYVITGDHKEDFYLFNIFNNFYKRCTNVKLVHIAHHRRGAIRFTDSMSYLANINHIEMMIFKREMSYISNHYIKCILYLIIAKEILQLKASTDKIFLTYENPISLNILNILRLKSYDTILYLHGEPSYLDQILNPDLKMIPYCAHHSIEYK